MSDNQIVSITKDKMCLEQDIGGTLWRFYYQRVDNQWIRYTRVKVDAAH